MHSKVLFSLGLEQKRGELPSSLLSARMIGDCLGGRNVMKLFRIALVECKRGESLTARPP